MHFKPEGFDQVLPSMKDKNGAWVAVNAFSDVLRLQYRESAAGQRAKVGARFSEARLARQSCYRLSNRKYGWDFTWRSTWPKNPYFIQGHRDVATRLRSGTSFVSLDNSAVPGGTLKIAMSEKDRTPVFFTAGGILKSAPHPKNSL